MPRVHWCRHVTHSDSPSVGGSAGRNADLLGERRLRLVVDHSAALRWQMIAIMLVIAAVARTGVPSHWVLLWLVAAICTREVRAAALVRMVQDTSVPISTRLRRTAHWTLALGVSIGFAALFMLRLDTAFDAVLTMILMSLSAGAVSTTATIHRAFVGFAAALCLPVALMWFLSGGWVGWCVGGMALMFFGVQLRFARQSAQTFEESFGIRLENLELLRQLTEERTLIAIARDSAVQANQSKSRFLAAASHDLRQPLQSLSLNIGALSRMPLDANSRPIAAEIAQSIDALRQMLDALLDISTLDAGTVTPNFQQLPLGRLLSAIGAGFRPAAEAKGLNLSWTCPEGAVVSSDAEMLRRVVSNLIDNAIKFTTQGGVALSVQPNGDRLRLTVSDTGRGIQPADQVRVFEDLTQLGNPQRNRAFGHGLGLGIVRRLVHLLGIEQSIESSVGFGTRFHLDIPRGSPVEADATDSHRPQTQLTSRRVLVLDDDPAVRSAYEHALRSLGCHVTCCAAVGDALAYAAVGDPEVALVDYRLADHDNGLDAIRRLRGIRPDLAAVIVSADMAPELREAAARLAVPLLRKPVTDATLTSAINDALQGTPLASGGYPQRPAGS